MLAIVMADTCLVHS